MKKIFSNLPAWTFEIEEVSAGVYKAIGTNLAGHSVKLSDTDYDALLSACRDAAQAMDEKTLETLRSRELR